VADKQGCNWKEGAPVVGSGAVIRRWRRDDRMSPAGQGHGRSAVDRNADAQGWDLVRKAVQEPSAEANAPADKLQREVRRLQARLGRVQARGGEYAKVGFSDDIRELLGRLEAGATLSTYVH